MRTPWTETEINDLKSGLDWTAFSARHPHRSYDSWEVKRRRVGQGSAGSRTVSDTVRLSAAVEALKTLTEFVGHRVRG